MSSDAEGRAPHRKPVPVGDLRSVPGLDVDRGLRFTRGDPALYLELLRNFVRDQRNLPEKLATALTEDELEAAERMVHTMRGLSSPMGADALTDAGGMLEEALRRGAPREEVERYADVVADEHGALFGPLTRLLGDP